MRAFLVLSLVGFSLQTPRLDRINNNIVIPVEETILSSELKIVSLLDQIILESLRAQRMSVISERKDRKRRRWSRKLKVTQQEGDMIPLARVG